MSTGWHLAFKEIWRNRGRFLLFSLVIGLITLLILFVAALGEGLGSGNREYLEKLDADLIVYSESAELQAAASRLDRATQRALGNVEGVRAAGPIGFASGAIPIPGADRLNVSLIGVEPGRPGEPPVIAGSGLTRRSGDEAIIDRTVARVAGLQVGDLFELRSIQEDEAEFFTLQVVGITDSRKYGIRPAVLAPFVTWDHIRPQAVIGNREGDLSAHVMAVQLEDPAQIASMKALIELQVPRTEAVDRKTAWENVPGYTEQQTSLNTQRFFALLIGVLVIGGFFQIQTLQKVPQIGMLKAIGTPNPVIAVAAMIQIVIVTVSGVLIGAAAAFGLSLGFPPNIPIVFAPVSSAVAIASILAIGPIGGLVSIRYSLGVEPLRALGLGS
ncbi:MAG: ABC transporter permease [Anaerolineae bacterium]|nr:ABC transporter permease [Anaerolineae bacterium]